MSRFCSRDHQSRWQAFAPRWNQYLYFVYLTVLLVPFSNLSNRHFDTIRYSTATATTTSDRSPKHLLCTNKASKTNVRILSPPALELRPGRCCTRSKSLLLYRTQYQSISKIRINFSTSITIQTTSGTHIQRLTCPPKRMYCVRTKAR